MRDKNFLKILAVLVVLLMVIICTTTLIGTVSALDITDQFLEEHYGYVVNPHSVFIDIVDGDNDSILLGHDIIFNGSSYVEISGPGGTFSETGTSDLTGDGITDTSFDTSVLSATGLYSVSDGTNTETLTVSYPVMELDLKVGNYSTTSVPRGTPLRIDFETNLDYEDRVDLRVITPDGCIITMDSKGRPFHNINITQLLEYGSFDKSKQLDTSDWDIGTWTIYVKTDKDNARGLDAKSNEKTIDITHPEIEIAASKINPAVNETIVLTVRGAPYHNISVESSCPSETVFEGGKYDYTGPDTGGPINDIIDEDGVRHYAVHFTDSEAYRIFAEDLDEYMDDCIDIIVNESIRKTWYVPDNFSTIQAAIYAASAGNTIIVRDGTYTENVKVDKTNLTIISEKGSAKTIINAAETRNPVLEITANYINISGFTIKGATEWGGSGIHLCANHCNISNNIVSNNDQGIYFDESTNNTLENNIFSNNSWASIMLSDSSNNSLKKNDISNNGIGIGIECSNHNTLTQNNLSNNTYGSLYCSGYSKTDFGNVIDTTNTINKNPVYYYFDQKDKVIENLNTSWMGFAYCSNFTIRNNNIHHGEGISFVFCNNSTITKNRIYNTTGNAFYKSNGNVISNNEIYNNIQGLSLHSSDNNEVINNSVNSNEYGISLQYSKNNKLKGNDLSNHYKNLEISGAAKIHYNNTIDNTNTIDALPLYYYYNESDLMLKDINTHYMGFAGCNNITAINNDLGELIISFSNYSAILNNNISNGMLVYVSNNITVLQNNITRDIQVSLSNDNTLQDNVINSSRIYLSSSTVLIVNNTIRDGGILCSYHSPSDLVIENNTILDAEYGIKWSYRQPVRGGGGGGGLFLYIDLPNPPSNPVTQMMIIKGNEILDNVWGIYLENVHSCTIMNNTISNNENGIRLQWCCYDNLIYNNYFDNTNNAYDDGYNNIWNITKTSGKNIVGGAYLGGNYWSDYIGNDTDGDGLGDTPYDIPGGLSRDYLPLMMVESLPIFDTGTGTYPSIFGTHNGTITPSRDITIRKLYTYPCVGTGGHTEYAEIRNVTWNATATWEGYIGDWHNITFDKTVVLMANKTYNYTIRTGSYPQIIHESPFNATGGTITCDKFTDANGGIYYDWIPAIRLE